MDTLRAIGGHGGETSGGPDGCCPFLFSSLIPSRASRTLVPGARLLARPQGSRSVYVCELTKRRYRGRLPKAIRGPDDVVAVIGSKLKREHREHFIVLLLNARHEVLGKETVSIGSLNASIVHPREVFKPALLQSAASIVLVHNHPSGDAEPSEEDLSITKRLVEAGELLGIGVLDHVIVASRGIVSFRSRQLL